MYLYNTKKQNICSKKTLTNIRSGGIVILQRKRTYVCLRRERL